jgi:hypothetical protein
MKTKPKHKRWRIRPGLYNYRGYCIARAAKGFWIVRDEEGGVFKKTFGLSDMEKQIDLWCKEEATP